MKSLPKMPCELIHDFTSMFCDRLYNEAIKPGEDHCRQLAAGLESFETSLRDWLIQELYASSIVEEK